MAPVVAAINHLLAQEAWARDALAMHAGKQACIDASTVTLRLRVTADGMVEASNADDTANVTIRVKLADLPLIAHNHERAFSYVKIEGDAEFANTISQLGKGLRWEAEHDLERFIGPIAANRVVGSAKGLFDAARTGQQKLAENVAEYFLEENPLLIRPAMVEEYAGEVSRLRDDVERTAKRIAKLESRLAPRNAEPGMTPRIAGPQDLDI
ncbi:ubiquinone biosynthesis accessory factor UbiJ [Massilia sp. TWP1-3-3]|uniref:ubiquinone biosynthesis accessory factor UbiJ n=1 Tax=Massilia sp. TWP1-3-3 TaxID=2804573 RepID=UPI003CE6F504